MLQWNTEICEQQTPESAGVVRNTVGTSTILNAGERYVQKFYIERSAAGGETQINDGSRILFHADNAGIYESELPVSTSGTLSLTNIGTGGVTVFASIVYIPSSSIAMHCYRPLDIFSIYFIEGIFAAAAIFLAVKIASSHK